VSIGEGTTIVDSVVRGPVVIGAGVTVKDAYIGPYTSVGDSCVVTGSEVEHSILLAGSRVENIGARLADSLLGVDAVVRRTPGVSSATRVMVGDNSEVDLG
jgi:glucose-1-phosphate thymidylyltransferase